VNTTLLGRLGLALVRPRVALALAGDRQHAGRSGSDLILALLVFLLATQLRALVGAVWLGSVVEASLGLRAAVATLTDALVIDLVILIFAAVVIWAGSGKHRELGRSFDLACVAVLPLLFVDLGVSMIVYAADISLPRAGVWVFSIIAYTWTAILIVLAVIEARRPSRAADPITRAGWAIAAVALAGIAVQVVWLVRHVEQVRPMQYGDPAPPLSLPRIAADGSLGELVTLPAGKVIVLEFWATWCGPCLKAMPKLDAFARHHPEITVLTINLDDAAEARAIFDSRNYSLQLLAGDRDTSDRYGVSSIPHTVLIDRAGTVRRVFRGGIVDLEREALLLK